MIERGVGLAFVGDTHQALPVGHAGAMSSGNRHANAAVELDTVHRLRDPDYAVDDAGCRACGRGGDAACGDGYGPGGWGA